MDIILSEETGPYVEMADALAAELGRHEVRRISAAALARDGIYGRSPDVVLALGTRALEAALAAHTVPIVAAMVPADSFERVLRAARRQRNARPATAVFLDQPARRRLNLIRLTLPGRHRVGVLVSPEREPELRQLRDAVADAGLSLAVERGAAAAVYPALSRLLLEAEVVLAVPDSAIFNSGNIHNILLATYRARVPLIGFSPAYVQAGALLALYSTPRQIAAQVAELAGQAVAGGIVPPPQYPRAFTVGANASVARSLDIQLEDAAILEKRLAALEHEP